MSIKAVLWAFAQELETPTQKLVLIALADFADQNGWCWPKQSRLAKFAAITRQACCRVIGQLEELGMVRRSKSQRTGSSEMTFYQLLMPSETDDAEELSRHAKAPHRPSTKQHPPQGLFRSTPRDRQSAPAADDGPCYDPPDESSNEDIGHSSDVAEGLAEPAVASLSSASEVDRVASRFAIEECDPRGHGCHRRSHKNPPTDPTKGFYDQPLGDETARERVSKGAEAVHKPEPPASQTEPPVEPVVVVEGAAPRVVEEPPAAASREVWMARLREAQALCAPVLDRTGASLETWVTFRLLCDPKSGGTCDWELDVVPALVSLTAWCQQNGKQIRRWESVERGAKLNRDKRLANLAEAAQRPPSKPSASKMEAAELRAIFVSGFAADWIEAREPWAHPTPAPSLEEVVRVLRAGRKGMLLKALARMVEAGEALWSGANT